MEMAAVDPLKKAGSAIRLLNILEMRDEPVNAGMRQRRSWLVETDFEQPYLRVDQELRGNGEVISSQIFVADQVVVALKAEADPGQALASIHQAGFERAQIIQGTSSVLVHLDRHDLDAVPEASRRLSALNDVLAAEPDGVGSAAVIPNDTSFGSQWHLHNTGQSGGVVDADVDAPELWDVLPALPAFPVAVLDSGLDYNHQDLVGALWNKVGDTPGNGLDDDGNGKVDDFRGWDFVNNDNDPMDDQNHGTHVSGTIAARRNNGLGVAGIFPEAQIVPLKILNSSNSGTTSNLIAALGYVRTLNVRLVNMSIGGYPSNTSVSNEITAGQAPGMLYVISAGNLGTNNDTSPYYPASYLQDNIIAVGNSDRNDVRNSGSNYGQASVDIFAPGTLIPSTIRSNGISNFTGTSMAAPHVTAMAAILWAARPQATWQEVKSLILQRSDTKAAFNGICVTGKRLNVNAVALTVLRDIAIERPAGTTLVSNSGTHTFADTQVGQPSTLTFTLGNQGLVDLSGLTVTINNGNVSDFMVWPSLPNTLAPGQSLTFDISFTPSATGARAAAVWISSNDPDETPFVINVTGTGLPGPEISVFHGAQEMLDGIATLSCGMVNQDTSITKTLRIQNVGAATLGGLQVSKTGGDVADFVTSAIAETLAPGAELTLDVTFTPSAPGARSAALSITSNDADENPFNITLAGTGLPVPEIAIFEDTQELMDGDATLAYGLVNRNTSVTKVLRIQNIGTATLTGLQVSKTGDHAPDFATSAIATSLAPDEELTLNVTFTPMASGARSAALSIASSDANENPFNIALNGTGVAVPEIAILDGVQELTDGNATLAYGLVKHGSSATKVLRVRNVGTTTLNGLQIIKAGDHAADFSTPAIVESIEPGGEFLLDVTFAPQTPGTRGATLSITSNDADESPFDLVLTGTGVPAPEIAVDSMSGTPQTAGVSTIHFGNTRTTDTYSTTITVRNTGSADLTVTPAISGPHATEFTLSSTASVTLAPATAQAFQITCQAADAGLRSANLRLANNDANENPFDLALRAVGVLPQPPVFTTQPQSQLVLLGSAANFDPVATGDPVINYEWKKGSTALRQGTQPGFTIAVTKPADAAAYTVIADNPVGPPVPSTKASLGIVTPNEGTQVLKAGVTLTLRCTVAAPTAPDVSVKYSWRRAGDLAPLENGPLTANGPVVAGADKPTLTITKMRAMDSGAYTCLVTYDTPGNDPQLTNGNRQIHVVDAVPVMNAVPLPASVSISQSLDETVTATRFPTGFTVTGLPKGLAMDSKTGRITGKPTEVSKKNSLGAYVPNKITFKAANAWGPGPALDFFITIVALDPSVVGTFNGVVARSAHSNFGLGGHVQLTVGATGAVSGSATLAGQKHPVAGVLDISLGNDPTANLAIKRTPASLGDLQMQMNIVTGGDLLQGRIIEPRFEQTTNELALGAMLESGLVNGPVENARFDNPGGIAILPNSSGYVSDTGNNVIRFVDSQADTIATFAGNPASGSADGTGAAASFNGPEGIALDTAGNLYVADTGNSTIRKITPGGVVTTFVGSTGQVGSTNGTGSAARFDEPCALCLDPSGNLYVVDRGNHLVRKITPAGAVTTLAGKVGVFGHKDGSGTAALFNSPRGIAYEPVLKALFVTDTQNHVVRKITLGGAVTTYAGSPGVEGYADGLFANARFVEPLGIVSLGDGTIVVGDFLLIQLNANGTAGTVSDRVDTVSSLDHPVALGFDAGEGSVIAVHDRLHVLTSHEGDAPLQNALIEARRNPWTATNFVPVAQQGLFNAVLETTAQPDDASFPQGEGYVQVSISKSGVATWTGRAADGAGLTFGTFMAGDRSIPLNVPLYKNTGSLQGETFITSPDLDLIGDITPALDWYKIPQPLASTDRSYKSGFMLHALELYGGKYLPNNLHTYLGQTNSPATLGLNFTQSLINSFSQSFTLTAPNAVAVPANTKSLGLKIDPKTGIFTGSFKEGSPAITVPFAGILIHYVNGGNAREGRGHYLPPTSSARTAPIRSARVRLH